MVNDSVITDEKTVLLRPPAAKQAPHEDILHGESRIDNYFWLRDKSDPAVIDYLEAENTYTDAVMKPTKALQEILYQEMVARIRQTDLTVPYRDNGYVYYLRTEHGRQYPIHCRKKDTVGAPEQVLLDLNELARDQKYMALGDFKVSDNGNLLAYTTDTSGFREYTLQVKDLRTGAILADRVEKVTSIAWAADNVTLFYTVEDSSKRSYRLHQHAVGSAGPDALLYQEEDERFRIGLERTRSRSFLLLTAASHTASEVRFLSSANPSDQWQLIATREVDHEYFAEHQGDFFFMRTNSGGRNYRLVTAPVSDSRRENWREVIPHRTAVMLTGIEPFANHLVLSERENGLPHLRILPLDNDGQGGAASNGLMDGLTGSASHRIEFPEPVYAVSIGENHEFDATVLRFAYQSLVTPLSIFEYDMKTRARKLLKQTAGLDGYDTSKYTSERRYVPAADGTLIPVSLIYKKESRDRAPCPLLLYAYGSYGFSLNPSFSSNRLSLLDRGFIYAIAHVRGGGEMGKAWHDDGRMLNKKNTFTDFASVADFLITSGYTSNDQLVIEGGSAGGLLMGVVANERPDLCKAIVSHVPFVDLINTMSDASLPLTVGEYEEWGNPQAKEEYEYMKAYCPYTNLERKPYPAMLIKTSLNDSQVMYWEPAKYVARLRTLKSDSNILLLKVNMAAGHGGFSGRYDHLREIAFDYAFMLWQLKLNNESEQRRT